jgi:hypothetical protein
MRIVLIGKTIVKNLFSYFFNSLLPDAGVDVGLSRGSSMRRSGSEGRVGGGGLPDFTLSLLMQGDLSLSKTCLCNT